MFRSMMTMYMILLVIIIIINQVGLVKVCTLFAHKIMFECVELISVGILCLMR